MILEVTYAMLCGSVIAAELNSNTVGSRFNDEIITKLDNFNIHYSAIVSLTI